MSWTAPADKSIVRYRLFVNGAVIGSTTTTQWTFSNLTCGTTYTLGVASVAPSEGISATVPATATTDACATGAPAGGPPPSNDGSGSTPPPVSHPRPTPPPAAGAPTPAPATSTATTTSRTRKHAGPPPPSPTLPGLAFYSPLNNSSYAPFVTPFCHNGQNPVDNSAVHFGTYAFDTQIVGEGNNSIRFDLPAWSGGRTRCQLGTPRTINVGSDDYYGLMFYLPVGWQPAAGFNGVQIAEFNYEGLGTAQVALDAQSDHVTLEMSTGVATSSFPYAQYRSNADSPGKPNLPPLYAVPQGMQLGVWHEVVVHVHWATDSSGKVEVWHRVKGQSAWTQTVSFSGYPTLKVNPDGSYPTRTSDVIQAYRLSSSAPVTVWLDDFSRSGSFASTAATLP